MCVLRAIWTVEVFIVRAKCKMFYKTDDAAMGSSAIETRNEDLLPGLGYVKCFTKHTAKRRRNRKSRSPNGAQ